jgi:hypothetical protein
VSFRFSKHTCVHAYVRAFTCVYGYILQINFEFKNAIEMGNAFRKKNDLYTKNNVGGISFLPEKTSSCRVSFAFSSFRESLENERFVFSFSVRWLKLHVSKRSLDFKKLQEEKVSSVF